MASAETEIVDISILLQNNDYNDPTGMRSPTPLAGSPFVVRIPSAPLLIGRPISRSRHDDATAKAATPCVKRRSCGTQASVSGGAWLNRDRANAHNREGGSR